MSGATTAAKAVDATGAGAAVPIMLTELRLPTMKRLWADLAAQSNREGWPAERLLHTLLGHEMAERETRRLARARADSAMSWRMASPSEGVGSAITSAGITRSGRS